MSTKEEFQYDVSQKHSDKKSKDFLLACHLFKNVTGLFVSTFLIAHIYTFSDGIFGYIRNVAIFNIFAYISMMLFYMLFSIFVDKTNRIVFYRTSVIVTTILLIIIISFGEELAQLLILAGALYGLSEALYYSSYNVIKEEMVGKSSIGRYVTITIVLTEIVKTITPIILGAIITVTTYSETAIIVFVICAIQFGLTYGIKSKRPKDSHYNLREYKQMIETSPVCKQLKFLYIMCVIYGSSTIATTLINVYVMLNFGSSFSLGAISSIYAIVATISLLFLKKFTTPHNRKPVFITFTTLVISSAIVFVLFPNKFTLIILNLILAITSILYTDLIEKYRFSILKQAGLYDEIAEHQTMIENRINFTRIVGFIILLIISFLNSNIALSIYVVLALTTLSSFQILLMIFEKKYIMPQENIKKQQISEEEKTE